MEFSFQQTAPTILCCMCGIQIISNPSNMCVSCIRNQVDITEGIPKQLPMQFCRGCGRYLNPPNQWVYCELESKELLSLCIKKVKGLTKVKLVDAVFIWTEPHSKRIKMKLTIQKEVFTSTILQQEFIVEFVVHNQQCEKCQRREAKDTWQAVCQVRQRVDHKKTFFFLEQLILKHNAHVNCTNVKEKSDGLDFFYLQRSHAIKMVDFLQAVIPVRFKTSEKLISADVKSNTANLKHSFSVEIVPICREDLICLPKKLALSCGNISPLLLCVKISNLIYLMDPCTLQHTEISAAVYWNNPFRAISSSRQLIEYIILDVTSTGISNGKYALAEVQVVRAVDFGRNDCMFTAMTHLGNLLKPGDNVLGYDLSTAIFNDDDISPIRGKSMPDLILVRKFYPEKRKKARKRFWRLKALEKEQEENVKPHEQEKDNADYEQFMQDLEEDRELRSQFNLFKAEHADEILKLKKLEEENNMMDHDDNFPEVSLEELMDDLSLGGTI